MKTSFVHLFFPIISLLILENTQSQIRYQADIISSYQLKSNIQYGRAINASNSAIDLMLDIYTPSGDSVTNHPLVIFIHGGGFKDGDKVSNFGKRVCGGLAKRGYVAASINYRLNTGDQLSDSTKYFEALYRAVQDGKAAVRFFRKYAQKYGVDTAQIFVTGSSAGSKTALHMAYLDQNEVPSFINTAQLGTLEGNSGNPGYSSNIHGVINCWGALWDWRWIQKEDVPVYCIHGNSDETVPYDSSFSYHGFKYGSTTIHERAFQLGIKTGLTLFNNTGHTLDNSSVKQDSALKDFSKWLYEILSNGNPFRGLDEGRLISPIELIPEQKYPNQITQTRANYKSPFDLKETVEYYCIKRERASKTANLELSTGYCTIEV